MGDAPSTVNKTATAANGIISDLVNDVVVEAVEAALTVQFPFLAEPIIKQIFDEIVSLIANDIYKVLATGVTFTIIDAQTSQEASAVQSAASTLQGALQKGDPNAIQTAKTGFASAFGQLVHFDGSATP